jgi:hypothetical protein
MNSNEFVNWLKGFIDGCDSELNETQLSKIKDKLDQVYDVKCPQQIQPVTPSWPYVPPIGDQPYDPNRIWYTSSTGAPPSFGSDSEEYKH